MDSGISYARGLLFFIICIPALVNVVLAFWAIFELRLRNIHQNAKALWVLIILLVPIMGVIAFLIVQPGRNRVSESGDTL
jgi:hypothetical protein